MNILYVARHGSGDNDDEGAIYHALRDLGHTVRNVHEKPRHRSLADQRAITDLSYEFDFCLFHKWPDPREVAEVRCPRAFWYFDMVQPVDGDQTLLARSQSRVDWMKKVVPHCVAGFCTDGDWVDADKTGRLVHLMQGADGRFVGEGTPLVTVEGEPAYPPVMFTGMINHGQRRAEHVAHLQDRYGDRFMVLGDGGPRYRLHQRKLADVFSTTKVVVAPDGPSTDRYWSNRVYLTLGFGGFLLHPYCEGLAEQYSQNVELVMYKSRQELDGLIDFYLQNDAHRDAMRLAGYKATVERHLYRHRCHELVRVMKERL